MTAISRAAAVILTAAPFKGQGRARLTGLRPAVLSLAAALSLSVAGASGALAESLTLAQAYERMMSGEIEFEILDLERDVAAEVSRQARGALRPRVALNFEINTIDQNVMASDNESYGEARSRYGTTTMELTIRQPIYDAARWRQMGVADAQRELTRVKAEQARNDLIAQMTDSFLDVAQAQFLVRRSGSVIRTRQAFVAMLEASREAGRADLSTLLRAEGDILSAEGDLSEAEMERTQALFSFARFVGGEVTAVALTDNRFGMIGSEDLRRSLTRERLFDISPQMQIARAELALAQKLHHRSKAGYLPTVNLTAEVGVDETDGALFGGGSKIRNGKVGVGIEVPLYQGAVQQSLVREEAIRVQIAERRLELTRRLVGREFDALTAAEQRAAQRIGVLARHASAAAEALRTVRAEEEAGRVSADVVLERGLNVETIDIEMQVARLQQLRLQLRLLGLFGALDVNALSRQLNG